MRYTMLHVVVILTWQPGCWNMVYRYGKRTWYVLEVDLVLWVCLVVLRFFWALMSSFFLFVF